MHSPFYLRSLRYNQGMELGRTTRSFAGAIGRLLQRVADGLATDSDSDRPQLDGSDLMGEYNFQTGRMDCGADPYGWYEDDD